MKKGKSILVPFISGYGETLREMELPLKKLVKWDIPVPAEIMDPQNTRPGSTWSVERKFRLQQVEAGEPAYIEQSLLNMFKRKMKKK